MTSVDYYNHTFYLMLRMNGDKVIAKHVKPSCSNGNLVLHQDFTGLNIGDSVDFTPLHIQSNLRNFGEDIAKLLNKNGVLDEFLDEWDKHEKIRLCFLYPIDDTQQQDLLNIDWEYIYLPPKNTPEHDGQIKDYFLALNEKVSIVHWLPHHKETSDGSLIYKIAEPTVTELPASMEYLSFLPDDSSILQAFQKKQPEIVSESVIERIGVDDEADPSDLDSALTSETLVHITSHGGSNGLELEIGQFFESDDLPNIDQLKQLKAAIFLNCISAADGGVARALHEKGVSMVVGMTKSISFGAAAKFVEGFYERFAQALHYGLEYALVHGRRRIYSSHERQFGLPRLFLNNLDSTLIPKHLLFKPLTNMVLRFACDIRATKNLSDENAKNELQWMKMERWINGDHPKRKWLLVTGPAGEGKTTQIKLLLKSLIPKQAANPQKIIYHFCQDGFPETSRALDFVRDSLVTQLIHHYERVGYKEEIPKRRFPRLSHNADLALWDFIITPLSNLVEKQKIMPPVIVIDGLDFVPEFHDPTNSILGLLFRYRDSLENIARFLVTTDYVELEPRDIDGRQAEKPNEVSTNIYELTHHKPGDEDIIEIGYLEKPSILFQIMIKRFSDSGLQLSSSSIPAGKEWRDFYELLDLAIEKAVDVSANDAQHSRAWWQTHLMRFLNIVAITFESLPAPDVATITGLIPDGPEKKHLVSILSPFFKEMPEDNAPLSLHHKRIKSYLLNEMSYRYNKKESLADTHELLVDAFRPTSGQWDGLDWNTLDGEKWITLHDDDRIKSILRYRLHYLVFHAYYSCYYTSWKKLDIRRRRAHAFLALICDSGFRQARDVLEVGQRAALQDIWLGLRVINAEFIHAKRGKDHKKTRVAFDRLLAANQPNSRYRNNLIKLERNLREIPETDYTILFEFLNFKTPKQRAWWNDY